MMIMMMMMMMMMMMLQDWQRSEAQNQPARPELEARPARPGEAGASVRGGCAGPGLPQGGREVRAEASQKVSATQHAASDSTVSLAERGL